MRQNFICINFFFLNNHFYCVIKLYFFYSPVVGIKTKQNLTGYIILISRFIAFIFIIITQTDQNVLIVVHVIKKKLPVIFTTVAFSDAQFTLVYEKSSSSSQLFSLFYFFYFIFLFLLKPFWFQ